MAKHYKPVDKEYKIDGYSYGRSIVEDLLNGNATGVVNIGTPPKHLQRLYYMPPEPRWWRRIIAKLRLEG